MSKPIPPLQTVTVTGPDGTHTYQLPPREYEAVLGRLTAVDKHYQHLDSQHWLAQLDEDNPTLLPGDLFELQNACKPRFPSPTAREKMAQAWLQQQARLGAQGSSDHGHDLFNKYGFSVSHPPANEGQETTLEFTMGGFMGPDGKVQVDHYSPTKQAIYNLYRSKIPLPDKNFHLDITDQFTGEDKTSQNGRSCSKTLQDWLDLHTLATKLSHPGKTTNYDRLGLSTDPA